MGTMASKSRMGRSRLLIGRTLLAAIVVAPVAVFAAPASAARAQNPFAAVVRTNAGPTASASAMFTVPKLTCSPLIPFEATGELVSVRTLSGTTLAGVFLVCANGASSAIAAYQINGNQTQLSNDVVQPGEVISASVSESGSSSAVQLSAKRAGWSASANGAGATIMSVVVGVSAVNCIVHDCSPVPQFTPVRFTAASINGVNLIQAAGTRVDLVDSNGHVEARPTQITNGTSFEVEWVSSCAQKPDGRC
jgi:Peptidase A4 family